MNTRLNQIQNWSALTEQVGWSAALLAKKCGVSLRTLERHFLEKFGKCPRFWIAEQRRSKAIELRRDGWAIKEIAGTLGYEHASNFSRKFPDISAHG
jgi:AraC-like DNA-binding protein